MQPAAGAGGLPPMPGAGALPPMPGSLPPSQPAPGGLPPMPGAGGLPPMPGAGGAGGLPPMPGAAGGAGGLPPMPGAAGALPTPATGAPMPSGSGGMPPIPAGAGMQPLPPQMASPGGGAAPKGVFGGDMPALGSGAAAAGGNPLDNAFQTIMRVMPELDAYMEGLRTGGVEKVSTLQLTAEETAALQNEELHHRFLKIQTRARQLTETAGGAADDALVKDAVKFASDLEAHVAQIKSVHGKLGLPAPAVTGPRDVPKLQPNPGR